MNYRYSIIGALLSVLLFGCDPARPEPKHPTEPMPSDAWCDRAQAHLETLMCKEAHTKKGRTFADVCKENAHQETPINLFPECLSAIQDCSEADSCR